MLRQIALTILAASSAAIISLCFPSSFLSCLVFVAFIPLILVVGKDPLKVAFLRGYAAGFLFFILTLFWIHHVTPAGLLLLSAYLAIYWGVFAFAVAWSASWPRLHRALFLPAAWTALEYARAHLFTGFGWSALAHTQAANILFIQIADITGAYGLSFIIVLVNVLVADAIFRAIRREEVLSAVRTSILVIVVLFNVTLGYGVWRAGEPLEPVFRRIALIQANVTLADYWDPALKPYVVEKHLALSLEAMKEGPQMIVWPETSFPQFIWDYPDLFEKVRRFARDHRVQILLGAVTREGEKYFNSAILIDADGLLAGTYSKQHLVVLGEYIPFRKQFPILERFVPIDDFTPGTAPSILALGPGALFGALICFEDTIPEFARHAVLGGAGFLVNLTNDAWFGASRQARMHLDSAVFRAVENRVPLVRATNTGMSCTISAAGEVSHCVEDLQGRSLMAEGFSVVDVPLTARAVSFYTKYGDVFAMLCFPVILGMILILPRKPEGS